MALSPFPPFSPRLQPGLHRVVVERYDGRPQQHPQHPAHVAKERGEAVVVVLGRDGELWPGDGDADGGVAFAAVLGAVRSAVAGRGEKGGGSEDSLDAQAVGGGGAAGDAASLTDQLPVFLCWRIEYSCFLRTVQEKKSRHLDLSPSQHSPDGELQPERIVEGAGGYGGAVGAVAGKKFLNVAVGAT